MRAFKTVNDSYIEPISFIVPRRAEVFQGDIYPPAVGSTRGTSAAEWFGGKDASPAKIDLESIYDGGAPVAVPSDFKPSSTPAPVPKTSPPVQVQREEPSPVSRGPPPSISQQKTSMADAAAKFADDDAESSGEDGEDDEVNFNDAPAGGSKGAISAPTLAKPVERSLPTAAAKDTAVTPPAAATNSTIDLAQGRRRREPSPEAKVRSHLPSPLSLTSVAGY